MSRTSSSTSRGDGTPPAHGAESIGPETSRGKRPDAPSRELQLTGKEKALPSELSRGMKQKVAIACGLVHDPKALLFDEPLTGLDPLGIRHMKETIVRRGRAGAAVMVSSHLLHLVEEICTRILIIDRGVKVVDGTMADLEAHAEAGWSRTSRRFFLKVTSREGSSA